MVREDLGDAGAGGRVEIAGEHGGDDGGEVGFLQAAGQLAGRAPGEVGKHVGGGEDLAGAGVDEPEGEDGPAFGQDLPVAVEDAPAGRGAGDVKSYVGLGQVRVVGAAPDLEVEDSAQQ